MNNFLPLNRKIVNCWIWEEKPFGKGQAWIDLLLLANYEDRKTSYKGEMITCKRGDVNFSFTFLAKRWGWSKHKVTDFIDLLKKDEMVTYIADNHRTVITIVNYETFNGGEVIEGQQKDSNRTTDGHQKDTIKKEKKEKNNTNMEWFNQFWIAYPKKRDKKTAKNAFLKANIDEETFNKIMTAIEEQKKCDQWNKDNGQFIPNPSTWINQERWNDEVNVLISPEKTLYSFG